MPFGYARTESCGILTLGIPKNYGAHRYNTSVTAVTEVLYLRSLVSRDIVLI